MSSVSTIMASKKSKAPSFLMASTPLVLVGAPPKFAGAAGLTGMAAWKFIGKKARSRVPVLVKKSL